MSKRSCWLRWRAPGVAREVTCGQRCNYNAPDRSIGHIVHSNRARPRSRAPQSRGPSADTRHKNSRQTWEPSRRLLVVTAPRPPWHEEQGYGTRRTPCGTRSSYSHNTTHKQYKIKIDLRFVAGYGARGPRVSCRDRYSMSMDVATCIAEHHQHDHARTRDAHQQRNVTRDNMQCRLRPHAGGGVRAPGQRTAARHCRVVPVPVTEPRSIRTAQKRIENLGGNGVVTPAAARVLQRVCRHRPLHTRTCRYDYHADENCCEKFGRTSLSVYQCCPQVGGSAGLCGAAVQDPVDSRSAELPNSA